MPSKKMDVTKTVGHLSLFSFLISAIAATATPSSSDFIRQSCSRTLYPSICFNSLAPYSIAVHRSPVKLAVMAANVSLAKISNASSLAAALRKGSRGRLGEALRDCVESIRTAADLTKQAAAEIGKLEGAAKAGGIAWDVSNAQTWMSAAITNEETCLNGFDGLKSGSAMKAMCNCVDGVKKYTSNALSLLNVLVHAG